ncbi:uncharacterized protein LOC125780312 [Bactrocera dorsalis]|uniref:Uncharacterized protein LOC125780312 n=1 Tax=Bactrocera dorsalis TaxID=27457 RepID=A0ABM3K9V3_BACDO|nr:uncharacterized protein LOC125780312 [Bactrocera dorsalis]
MSSNEDSLSLYTVEQLKSWLRSLKHKTTGSKAELIVRLQKIPEELRGNFRNSMVDVDADVDCTQAIIAEKEQADEINEGASSINITEECGEFSNGIVPQYDASNRTSVEKKQKECDANEWRLLKIELELLKRECELKKMENELLMREKEQLRNSDNQTKNISNKQKFADVKELISEFSGSGECLKLWQAQLKNIQSVYQLDDNNLRALIANKLKGNALKWLHSRDDLILMPIDKFLKEMRSLFEEKTSNLMLKKKFEIRQWLTTESFREYFQEKLILANRILIGEDELVEYLIDGIPDNTLRSQAKMQRFHDKYELLEAFRNIQLPRYISKKMTADNQHEQSNNGQQTTRVVRCYNCNSVGHLASVCRKPKRELGACHVCAEVGHLAANCPQRKSRPVQHVTELMEGDEYDH